MTDRELMQMANRIEALAFEMKAPNAHTPQFVMLANEIRARARLAQPEPKPVAWKDAPSKIYLQVCEESNCDQPFDSHIEISWCQDKINNSDISYVRADIAPPQREWQGLTDQDVKSIVFVERSWADAVQKVEAKLKEKNGF